jgi:hypothetical protein
MMMTNNTAPEKNGRKVKTPKGKKKEKGKQHSNRKSNEEK